MVLYVVITTQYELSASKNTTPSKTKFRLEFVSYLSPNNDNVQVAFVFKGLVTDSVSECT